MNLNSDLPSDLRSQQEQAKPAGPSQRRRNNIEKVVDETAEHVKRDFESFLSSFTYGDSESLLYIDQIKLLPTTNSDTIYIDFAHLEAHNEILAQAIQLHYYRMEPYLQKAIQNLVRVHEPQYVQISVGNEHSFRRFSVAWYGLPSIKRLRELRMEHNSQLVCISGTVTRTSQVRPLLLFGTFRCKDCDTIIRDVEQEFHYTQPSVCTRDACGNRMDFGLLANQSIFSDWQKVRIQENANEIPSGAMPRSMDVIVRNESVERAKAGDKIKITGSPIVLPDVSQLLDNNLNFQRDAGSKRGAEGNEGVSGLKRLGVRQMAYKTVFLASFVSQVDEKNSLSALHDLDGETDSHQIWISNLTATQRAQIDAMKNDRRIYQKLAKSICPHIFGHEDIKKGLLLQLLGGVHKTTHEGINLRGDINVCIVGDPSTAKSQFLKYVSGFMPRAIYTSGKASSAAGLTASVMRDEETNEVTIEAGALMLADNGICCIDEFDKMDLKDQVAIHEAMEQQTITITKAGIQATLNARASILAAANPVHGRYDKKLSLRQNIAMSPPIMSRFDLFFIVLDECHEQTDLCISQHIISFHRFQERGVDPEYNNEQLKTYITYARGLKPLFTAEARKYLVTQYRNFRQDDCSGLSRSSYRITVRQLESMVRLAEALAKLYASEYVLVQHVTEAAHLLKTSIVNVEMGDLEMQDVPEEVDDTAEFDHVMAEVQNDDGAAPEQKQKITLSVNDYKKIQQSIILQIRRNERSTKIAGMTKSAIINWYLEDLEALGAIETEEALLYQRKVVKSVLSRMIKNENTLLEMKDLTRLEDSEDVAMASEDPVLVISPAYEGDE